MHPDSIKLICTNDKCSKFNKFTYRRYNILKSQVCSSCHCQLSRPTNKSYLRSDTKARQELQSFDPYFTGDGFDFGKV